MTELDLMRIELGDRVTRELLTENYRGPLGLAVITARAEHALGQW